MKLYVYNEETEALVDIIEGDSNDECEAAFNDAWNCDIYSATYTPREEDR